VHAGTDLRRARVRAAATRDVVSSLVLLLVLVVVWEIRLVDHAAHPPAAAAAAALDATFVAWEEQRIAVGVVPVEVAPGVVGARLEREGFRDRWILVTEADGRCYGLWWDEQRIRRGRSLPDDRACVPGEAVATTRFRVDETATWRPGEPSDWSSVLPSPQRQRWWFLPVLFVGGTLLASRVLHLTLLALTGEPGARRLGADPRPALWSSP
jgi:hypothetical protein